MDCPLNNVTLMGTHLFFRIHTGKGQVRAVIYTEPVIIEILIVKINIFLSPIRVFPDPFLKGFLYHSCLFSRQSCLFLVDYIFHAVARFNCIFHGDYILVQKGFNDRVCVDPLRTVCLFCDHGRIICGLVCNLIRHSIPI